MYSQKDESRFCIRLRSLAPERLVSGVSILLLVLLPCVLGAQIGPADYERAFILQQKYMGLVLHLPDQVEWMEGTDRFVDCEWA